MIEELSPSETLLVGAWLSKNGHIIEDPVSLRIRWLILSSLRRNATDATGWDTLYEDPRDGRLWELIYPQSEMHGGGPPLLRVVTEAEARLKYAYGDRH
jgi:hypothetical protein